MKIEEINIIIEDINKTTNKEEGIQKNEELFYKILKENTMYVVAANKETNENENIEEIDEEIAPYTDVLQDGGYFMRIFSHKEVADNFAKHFDIVSYEGQPLTFEISVVELAELVKKSFISGTEGLVLNEGENWTTIKCEEFLKIIFERVINSPKYYTESFIQMVKLIDSIAESLVEISVPIRYYNGMSLKDILSGRASLYLLPFEINSSQEQTSDAKESVLNLIVNDKIEEVKGSFEEEVTFIYLDIYLLYSVVYIAFTRDVEKVVIVTKDGSMSAQPGELLWILNEKGVFGYITSI